MRSRLARLNGYAPIGAVKVVPINLVHAAPAPAPSAVTAAAPPASSAPGWWASASTTEKVAIVGGGALTVYIAYLAFRPRRRRR